ncbi:MAG TPA: PAS domain-containing protein, partial [Hyphomicrobiaceae bacterium]|nr:PAS domain-containing protein [Hyphomicrobiaceae bacterium]
MRGVEKSRLQWAGWLRLAILALFCFVLGGAGAQALDAVKVGADDERIEITPHAVVMDGQGDNLRVNTAAGLDGIVRQMSVKAARDGSNPTWIVFALRNVSDTTLVRWVTAKRYHLIGSRVMWPDLDASRLQALTPSVGFLPQRVSNDAADIFRISLEPGQTVTYVAELASERARLYLWQPHAYELQTLDRQLFNGIMLGIVGVMGLFLTSIFAANHRAIFPSAALVAWCVLAYLCVDFGFWHKLLQLRSEDNAVYRAATESAIAASLVIFLHAFLRLGSWHGFFRMLSWVWITAQVLLVFVAVLDPRLASTFARLSFAAIGGIGSVLTLFLVLRGQDRALSLIPTWLFFLVWTFGAAVTVMGQLNGDLVVSGLVVGLTLIVLLIGFTVTQFAFGAAPSTAGASNSEQSLRSLAVDGAGAAVWEWHARRGEVKVSPLVEASLGLDHGQLSTKVEDFLKYLHPSDQERLRVLLWSLEDKSDGVLRTDFRIRHADNSYRWFDLEASSAPTSDRRAMRCVGLLRDVTD